MIDRQRENLGQKPARFSRGRESKLQMNSLQAKTGVYRGARTCLIALIIYSTCELLARCRSSTTRACFLCLILCSMYFVFILSFFLGSCRLEISGWACVRRTFACTTSTRPTDRLKNSEKWFSELDWRQQCCDKTKFMHFFRVICFDRCFFGRDCVRSWSWH